MENKINQTNANWILAMNLTLGNLAPVCTLGEQLHCRGAALCWEGGFTRLFKALLQYSAKWVSSDQRQVLNHVSLGSNRSHLLLYQHCPFPVEMFASPLWWRCRFVILGLRRGIDDWAVRESWILSNFNFWVSTVQLSLLSLIISTEMILKPLAWYPNFSYSDLNQHHEAVYMCELEQ